MDWQTPFNAVVAFLVMLAGVIVNDHRQRVGKIEEKIDGLPHIYARRDDMKEIKDTLIRIESKLDGKQDRE